MKPKLEDTHRRASRYKKLNIEIINQTNPGKDYYLFRWEILRKPLKQPIGTEQDNLESESYHFIMRENNTIMGIGRLHKVTEKRGQIRFMAVSPVYQKRNIGSQIIDKIITKSKEIGLEEIILNARESVVPFYKKNGFEIKQKSHLLFGKIQHYLMVKNI